MSFVINDENVQNTHGFYLVNKGGRFDRFKDNPVMLFNHNYDKIMGRWDKLRVEGNQLIADEVFDEADPKAAELKGKVDRDFLKGASPGIYPINAVVELRDDVEVLMVTEWELLEISLTSVPSNKNSIRMYADDGTIMSADDIKLFAKDNTKPNFTKKMDEKTIAVLVGLAANAKSDEIMTALQGVVDKNKQLAKDLQARDEKITQLQAEVKAAQDEKIKALIDGAIAEKKIDETLRETYTNMAANDYAGVQKALDKIQGVGRVTENLGADSVPDAEKDWDFNRYVRENKAENLKATNLPRFKELYKKQFGREYQG